MSRNWSSVEREATEVCEYNNVKYFRWKKDRKWWFGKDKAGHANSQYKAYEDKGDRIVLHCSVDSDGNFMTDKHESGKGRSVKKKDMKVVKGSSKK